MIKSSKSRDPSRTLTLRNNFVRATNAHFRKLRIAIKKYIVTDDALGDTGVLVGSLFVMARYEYVQAAEKLKAFTEWLGRQVDAGILYHDAEWGEEYIGAAYKQGRLRAMQAMKKAGVPGFADVDLTGLINSPLMGPTHVDSLRFLFARDYAALANVTAEMSGKMGNILAMGMGEGLNPREIAKGLSSQLDMSLNRARTIARTEIMRAHHNATFNSYKDAEIEDVFFDVEWASAKDDRVCPECGVLDGRVFKLDHMKDTIPLHPNCRCVMLPIIKPAGTPLPEPEDAEDFDGWLKKTMKEVV